MTEHDRLLIENYMNLMWGEFTEIRKHHFIAPLILAFSIIEASAKLAAPIDKATSKARFLWWVEEFLKDNDGHPYPSIALYGARCGLFHEYGLESDLSRSGKCPVIAWASGNDDVHGKSGGRVLMFSREVFFEDLYRAGLAQLERLKIDDEMNRRFAERLPSIFGVKEVEIQG